MFSFTLAQGLLLEKYVKKHTELIANSSNSQKAYLQTGSKTLKDDSESFNNWRVYANCFFYLLMSLSPTD